MERNESKYKAGEFEAMCILKQIGYEFNDSHYDDGREDGKPDLQLTSGRYIEVTRTYHNSALFCKGNRFSKLPLEKQLAKRVQVSEALQRVTRLDYDQSEDGVSDCGMKQLEADRDLLLEHLGVDASNWTRTEKAEWKDSPIIEYSVENIIRKIESKSKKHPNDDTDLFLFVAEEEMKILFENMQDLLFRNTFESFQKTVCESSFNEVFLCQWSLREETPNIISPVLYRLRKTSEERILWERVCDGKTELKRLKGQETE